MMKPKHVRPKTTVERIKMPMMKRLMSELHLWKNRVFIVWVSAITCAMFGYYIPYVHLVSSFHDVYHTKKDLMTV